MRSSMLFLCCFMILSLRCGPTKVLAFTGTYGINYGRIADNLPSPERVVTLLKAAKIKNVRIYDTDHSVLNAFKGSELDLTVAIGNEFLREMSVNEDHAVSWIKYNVQSFLPDTRILGIVVGNEVLGSTDQELAQALFDAIKNVYNGLKRLQLADNIEVSTPHSQAVFTNSYPPSSCIFKEDVLVYMKPILGFFSQITDLHYDSMLDAQIDAAYAALEAAGYDKMEVRISETGWASASTDNETGATIQNARTYNLYLCKCLFKKKGTPLRPKIVVKAYIFALFNEDMKPYANSEKHYGLFEPNGSIAYNIGYTGLKSSSASPTHLTLKDIYTHDWSSAYDMVLICLVPVILASTI